MYKYFLNDDVVLNESRKHRNCPSYNIKLKFCSNCKLLARRLADFYRIQEYEHS